MDDSSVILIFLRAPEPGKVKTRLARHLGDPLTVMVYKDFVRDILETATTAAYPVTLCFYPETERNLLISWMGDQYAYRPQSGNNLGERMANAFSQAFSTGIDRAILIGTDIPDLPGHILEEAFDALGAHDAVIGPATDGGYYLVGFNTESFLPDIFTDIPWGNPTVFHRTMAIFNQHRSAVHRLPIWRDVDDYQDLIALSTRTLGKSGAGKHSAARIAALIQGAPMPCAPGLILPKKEH